MLAACAWLAGCADPLAQPIDLFHGLEGGEIAAERPPPPGAGKPYPKIGTVPDKPDLPSSGFRTALYSQLATERDQKALMAADLNRESAPPPPQASRSAAPAASESSGSVNSAPEGTAQASTTQAGTAAPSAAPAAAPGDQSASNATISAADAPAKPAAKLPPPPPPGDAGLQIAGDLASTENLPLVPDAPPPPAAIEGAVPAEPAPTPRLLPDPLPLPAGRQVFFASGSDVLAQSQAETLALVAGKRGKAGTIEIIGLGEADSDTPLGQEAAIDLALRRARAVAVALAAKNIPPSALRIAARPYGRGAFLRVL